MRIVGRCLGWGGEGGGKRRKRKRVQIKFISEARKITDKRRDGNLMRRREEKKVGR